MRRARFSLCASSPCWPHPHFVSIVYRITCNTHSNLHSPQMPDVDDDEIQSVRVVCVTRITVHANAFAAASGKTHSNVVWCECVCVFYVSACLTRSAPPPPS